MIKIVKFIKWTCILLGGIGSIIGVLFTSLKHKSDQMTISQVKQIGGNNLNGRLSGVSFGGNDEKD